MTWPQSVKNPLFRFETGDKAFNRTRFRERIEKQAVKDGLSRP